MLEKYTNLLEESLRHYNKANSDGATESSEYFRGEIYILEQIIEDLEDENLTQNDCTFVVNNAFEV